eukprot:m.305495 g.305495  ORF g.305495 m.305495 type:complete len:196 (-) comp19611_c0_seq17:2078-2665(-)
MKLVVLGAQSLDDLQGLVETHFPDIPNDDAETPQDAAEDSSAHETVFPADCLPLRVDFEPVRETRHLMVLWPVPATRPHFEARPTHYLSHLIGHEGPGSLLAHLKDDGLADGLTAGTSYSFDAFSIFKVTIKLTEFGAEHPGKVLAALYRCVAACLRRRKQPLHKQKQGKKPPPERPVAEKAKRKSRPGGQGICF